MSKLKHITRMKNERCWWVRFFKGTAKQQFMVAQKAFYDSQYHNSAVSLIQAKGWRDDFIKNNPLYSPRESQKGIAHSKPASNNKSGIVGVCLIRRKHRRPVWCAQWMQTVDGERVNKEKAFPFDDDLTDDEQRSKEAAILYRQKMLKIHYKKSN